VFDNPANVPDAPPVLLTSCTRANAVRVVGNGACTDDGFGSEQKLGYAAPAGDQLLSLCLAVKEACTVASLLPFCVTTLDAHCRLAVATPTPTPAPTVTPTPQPTPTPKPQGSAKLFVTSQGYPGLLGAGGLSEADRLCRQHATAGALPNATAYRAIISDSQTNAKDRFEFTGPITLVNGVVVAQNETDLWDGSVAVPINVTETGKPFVGIVFTGTEANGEKDTAQTTWCSNWTSASGGVEAGRFDKKNGQWISIYGSSPNSAHSCSNVSALYCIGPS
jgi:hypothetical protein